MNRTTVVGWLAAGSLLIGAARADAQDPPISRLLPEMIKLTAVVGKGDTGDHSQHFVPGIDLTAVSAFNRALLFQAATFPIGPTSMVVTAREPDTEPRL